MGFIIIQLTIALILGLATALIARSKSRNAFGWFWAGFFGGIIGLIIVAVLPNLKQQEYDRQYAERERHRLREQLRQERLKSEAFRQYSLGRIDEHDRLLGTDTRQMHPGLPGGTTQALPGGSQNALPGFTRGGGAIQPFNADAETTREEFSNPYRQASEVSTNRDWYYERHGQSIGPLNTEDISRLIRSGQLESHTLVWAEHLEGWKQIAEIQDLKTFFQSLPSTEGEPGIASPGQNGTQWFYARNGQSFGPIATDSLRKLFDSGELNSTTLLWKDGLAEWTMAKDLPDFPAGRPS